MEQGLQGSLRMRADNHVRDGLLVIDMQNYFFRSSEKRVNFFPLVDSINDLIRIFENSPDSLIIHIATVHKADKSTWSRNMKQYDSGCLIEGTDDAMIVKELRVNGPHHFVNKTRHSAFLRTNLEATLRNAGVERLFICGAYTHGCVALSAVDAWSLDFEVIIARDCIFSHRKDLADFITERLEKMLRIEFLSNEQIGGLIGTRTQAPGNE